MREAGLSIDVAGERAGQRGIATPSARPGDYTDGNGRARQWDHPRSDGSSAKPQWDDFKGNDAA